MKKHEYTQSVGRRKTATASVRLKKGAGEITVNNKPLVEYFEQKEQALKIIQAPLEITGNLNKFDISAKVSGGGKKAQMGAMRLGIARCLNIIDPELHSTLKKASFLTRDPRRKERKKPGLKGARRAPQWSKR
ncbi:MAG: 30S ribosomal protein S9 [Candidatus Berkelbacteria bacterium]|nr:30S ribosomal protein S9 [Candidatus Berkelbacteria bacterium]